MRYFLGLDGGGVIRQKQAISGTNDQVSRLVTNFLNQNPGWTVQEVDQATFDATSIVTDQVPLRSQAVDQMNTDIAANSKFIRAVLLVILDEVNLIRSLLPVPQSARTVAQMKTAITNKINSGAAD